MKKTSKTQSSPKNSQILKINSSLDNWAFQNRHDGMKRSLHELSHCFSCGSDLAKSQAQSFQPMSVHQYCNKFSKSQFSPVYKHMIVVPDVSSSVSQHKEGSKLSLQLNQISISFNKENKRIQEALLEIRQSSVKKDNQRFLKSISLSKKSQTSEKKNKKIVENNKAKLQKFQKLVNKKQLKKQNNKDLKPSSKLRKRNLNDLMKQQRNILKTLGSNLRSA